MLIILERKGESKNVAVHFVKLLGIVGVIMLVNLTVGILACSFPRRTLVIVLNGWIRIP